MKKLLLSAVFISTITMLSVFTGCASKKVETPAAKPATAPVVKTENPADLPLIRFSESIALKDTGSKPFKSTSAFDTVTDMTVGWNLGNTMDAPNEQAWGQPRTTKAMIDGLAASGIKTLRLPVSWSKHVTSNYTIDTTWMERVKTIVDWAIEDGMYVILNSHHDNLSAPRKMYPIKGYYPNEANFEGSEIYLTNIWTQICMAFNNGYDEHLIFETMNEPRAIGTNYEWGYDANVADCREYADYLNRLNQIVVDVIRASGGNNQKRYIMCPGLAASPSAALADAFVMPKDDEPGKLMLSVHMYSPYIFAMQSPGSKNFTTQMRNELAVTFKKLNEKFCANGYPVVVGEMGATNKDNLDQRVAWTEAFLTLARRWGMTCCLWDNGVWEIKGTDYSEHYGFYNRRTQTWYFPELLDAMVKYSAVPDGK